MAWKVYKTVFELKTPLHIGAKRVGMIQRTRHYIPAMTFWGALTNRLTRFLFSSPVPEDYRAVGAFCNSRLVASYFFPMVDDELMIPKYGQAGKWIYGRNAIAQSKFEKIFFTGYGSTAIAPKFTAAQEASLHEIQAFSPRVNYEGVTSPVRFWGYLFAAEGEYKSECGRRFDVAVQESDIKLTIDGNSVSISELLGFLQVGGERTYGYGRLALLSDEFRSTEGRLWDSYTTELDRERPGLSITAMCADGRPIPAHLLMPGPGKYCIKGVAEPVVSRHWGKSSRGAGEYLANFGVCFAPGSTFWQTTCVSKLDVSVEDYGILKVV